MIMKKNIFCTLAALAALAAFTACSSDDGDLDRRGTVESVNITDADIIGTWKMSTADFSTGEHFGDETVYFVYRSDGTYDSFFGMTDFAHTSGNWHVSGDSLYYNNLIPFRTEAAWPIVSVSKDHYLLKCDYAGDAYFVSDYTRVDQLPEYAIDSTLIFGSWRCDSTVYFINDVYAGTDVADGQNEYGVYKSDGSFFHVYPGDSVGTYSADRMTWHMLDGTTIAYSAPTSEPDSVRYLYGDVMILLDAHEDTKVIRYFTRVNEAPAFTVANYYPAVRYTMADVAGSWKALEEGFSPWTFVENTTGACYFNLNLDGTATYVYLDLNSAIYSKWIFSEWSLDSVNTINVVMPYRTFSMFIGSEMETSFAFVSITNLTAKKMTMMQYAEDGSDEYLCEWGRVEEMPEISLPAQLFVGKWQCTSEYTYDSNNALVSQAEGQKTVTLNADRTCSAVLSDGTTYDMTYAVSGTTITYSGNFMPAEILGFSEEHGLLQVVYELDGYKKVCTYQRVD